MVQTGFSAPIRRSNPHYRAVLARTKVWPRYGRVGRKGFSDQKYPYRLPYARFYLSPMGDTKVPFVTKPCWSLPVRRRRVENRGARRPRADEGTPLLFPFVASPPDIRCVFWVYFLSIAVPAFSTLSPDLSISSDAFWVRLGCSL